MNNCGSRIWPLSGEWQFQLDPAAKGVKEAWQKHPEKFTARAQVPATIQEQEIGFPFRQSKRTTLNTHESFDDMDPSFLTTKSECYTHAWYTREAEIPAFEDGMRLELCFDVIHPHGEIYLDGELIARHVRGPMEPCRVDITDRVRPGEVRRITVHLLDTGFMTQGVVKWPYATGLYRDVYFRARSPVAFEDVYTRPCVQSGLVDTEIQLGDMLPGRIELTLAGKTETIFCENGVHRYNTTLRVPEHECWSPEHPQLYKLTVRAMSGEAVLDERTIRIGFKKLERRGDRIFLNGKPFYVRGTGFAGMCYGLYPGKSAGWYRELVRRVKEYGFNYLRLHTCSFEQELLDICDEEGLFVQSELFSVFFESPREREETRRQCLDMVLRNRSHPCIGAYVMGNEHDHASPVYHAFRDELCRLCRRMDPDSLVIDSDGISPTAISPHDESDASLTGGTDIGNVLDLSPQIAGYARLWRGEKPYLLHEFNYTESFPRVGDIPRYTQMLKPFWLNHAVKSAKQHGTERLLHDFVRASEPFHYRQVRRAMEDVRKTPGVCGFGHWGFIDHVHESIGLLNMFLEDKGGSAEDFLEVNGDVILALTTDMSTYVGRQGEKFRFSVSVCSAESEGGEGTVSFRLNMKDKKGPETSVPVSWPACGVNKLEGLSVVPPVADRPYHAVLEARLEPQGVRNHWDLWFFPERKAPSHTRRVLYMHEYWATMTRMEEFDPAYEPITEYALWDEPADAVLVSPILTDAVADYLIRGGDVLLLPVYYGHGGVGLPVKPSSYAPMPSFMGTVGGCGTLIADTPLTRGFPGGEYCDLQYFDLLGGERAPHVCVPFHHGAPCVYDLDEWPVEIEPIIRSIPNWKNCTNRAYLFETGAGKGRLLACQMRVMENIFLRPEADWWMDRLVSYMESADFSPRAHVTGEQLNALRKPTAIIRE